ncbi:6-hydroxymethylpterin diphosphokinase MptE-like protein [Succinivibrio dextrinosolvens]|uniref:6-hydroxymethylpterin diphosphokinase MptE-like protein n=1 Tax=Succinivibrio dextrinosolvens TaxID=83771 RepID=UPI00116017B9|nr:6-hydroxymethylpterin diphosphokinase MptE-like protein [Succinivibrio dextrinosolvens]
MRTDVEKAIIDKITGMGFIDDYLYGISHGFYSIINKKNFVIKKELPQYIQNFPVFVIGSGPSLDKDLSFIAKNQDKAIIIACGTAIDALYHYGIKPDFFANTERVPETVQALETIPDKSFFDDIILLAADVCHPLTVNKFKYTALLGKADEPLYKYLIEQYPQYKSIQYVTNMNPLVGNMGVAGAIYLGFKNLILFGIDCGSVIKGKAHSNKTTLYREYGYSDDVIEYQSNEVVEGNFEKFCGTNSFFQMSVRKIEEILRLNENNGVKCINCSNGCKIKYTISCHSDQLVTEFDSKNKIDKDIFLKTFLNNKVTSLDLSEEQFYKLFKHQPIKKICSDLIEFISKKRNSVTDYIWMMEEISEHLAYLKTTKEQFLCSKCILPTLNHCFVIMTQALYLHANEDNVLDIAENIKNDIVDFLTEFPELFEKLPDYIMGEELKHFPNGMVGRDLSHCKAIKFPPKQNIIKQNYDDPIKEFIKRYE